MLVRPSCKERVLYEHSLLGKIDGVTVFHPEARRVVSRVPSGLILSFEEGPHRVEFSCTPADGITFKTVKKRTQSVMRDPKKTNIKVAHDGIQVFISFSGPLPTQYADGVVWLFYGTAMWSAIRQHAVSALLQLPGIVEPLFVTPRMPSHIVPLFGYAKVVANLIAFHYSP